jgi:hypothetical protein
VGNMCSEGDMCARMWVICAQGCGDRRNSVVSA